jgi:hypothetical protein
LYIITNILKPNTKTMRNKFLKRALLLPALILLFISGYAQTTQRAADRVQQAHQQGQVFQPVSEPALKVIPVSLSQSLQQQASVYNLFEWTADDAVAMNRAGTAAIELTLPLPGAESVTLELVEVDNFSSDFSAVTAAGERIKTSGAHYYQGVVKGNNSSLAAISIFNDEIAGFFSGSDGNYVVGKLKNTDSKAGYNIVYKESSLTHKGGFNCSTLPDAMPIPPGGVTNLTTRCVRMAFETEYDFYTAFGFNASSVSNYVTNLFNQVRTLYNNDGVSVTLSQIIIWTTTDPYTGANTSTTLSQFQSVRTSFTGDVAQLLTTRAIGGGLAAVIYGLCGTVPNRLCVSGNLTTSFPNVPTYSWEVMVTTHEFGHLLGSRHTHACVWNGNNTAIDGCSGFVEGSCALPGIPAGGGTVMSYCHLQSVGINFNNGFGPQPAAQIRNSVEASACLTSCAPIVCNPPGGLAASSVTSSSAVVSWSAASSAGSYTVEYKASTSGTWLTAGTTAATSLTIPGLSASTVYDWRVRTNCTDGSVSGYAQSQFTTLGTGTCGVPTGLAGYGDCGYADLCWNAVSGAVSYTVEYKKSTSTTWLVAASGTTATCVGISGSGGLYNWRVRANCAGGSSADANSTVTLLNPTSPACRGCLRLQTSMKLSPQPASGQVVFTFEAENAEQAVITIRNQFGLPVFRQTITEKEGFNSIRLNVGNLRNGVYTLAVDGQGANAPICPRIMKLVIGEK